MRKRGRPNKEEAATIIWTPAIIALLGKVPDRAIATQIGVSQQSVRNKKLRLGLLIRPKRSHKWKDEYATLLGTDTDWRLGRLWGVHKITVRDWRNRRGIRPFKVKHR